MEQFEKSLEDLYKSAPALPQNAKKVIVEWLPWVNLVLGIVTLVTAWSLWHLAHAVNYWVDVANTLSANYGGNQVVVNHMTTLVWASLLVLAAEAVIYILAFSPLKERKMVGWRFLFYATFINVAYALVRMFTDYGGVFNFIMGVIASAIGLYFLFQIKSEYSDKKVSHVAASKAPEAPKK